MCSENEPTALTYSTARSVFRAPWSLRRPRKWASALSLYALSRNSRLFAWAATDRGRIR